MTSLIGAPTRERSDWNGSLSPTATQSGHGRHVEAIEAGSVATDDVGHLVDIQIRAEIAAQVVERLRPGARVVRIVGAPHEVACADDSAGVERGLVVDEGEEDPLLEDLARQAAATGEASRRAPAPTVGDV